MNVRADVRATIGNLPLILGALGIAAIAFVALFGDRFAPYDPQAWRLVEFYDGRIIVPPSPPDSHHLLGTDPLGRDQLSRLLWGARLSLQVTVLAVVLRLALALLVGALAAVARGVVDGALITLTNVVSGYPQLMLALLIGVALRDLGVIGFVVALGVVGWPELARFLRVELRRIGQAPYVEAAQAMGASPRRIALGHVARNALPQIVGVTALETAAVLLLLAELGFIGLFVSGGTGFTDDLGRPALPVRDRAPEWGQMLAGAHGYITNREWVAYVPALVVIAAVFVFNLFGEGIRAALDPHSRAALSPRALAWGARGIAALVLVGASGFALSTVAAARGLTYEDGLERARAAAERERPGSVLVATVVRFSSQSHGLDRPEKLNYYFVDPEGLTLRVGFVDADPNAAEVKRFEDDDGLGEVWKFAPLGAATVKWQDALLTAERTSGNAYRTATRNWTARVILRESAIGPVYRVRYGPILGSVAVEVAVDAQTGSTAIPPLVRLGDAIERVRSQLGSEPVLLRISASWRVSGATSGFGAGTPTSIGYEFARADGTGGSVRMDVSQAGVTQIYESQGRRSPPLDREHDVQGLFARVEDAGGRALRAEWARTGTAEWFASGTLEMVEGTPRFTVFYNTFNRSAQFRLEVATGAVTRVG
jgi:ABC-type dipeptide/oligopeptide/nickel transport system permease subunit